MAKKIYGCIGLMEWVVNIPIGKAYTRVEFSGGFPTAYGIAPAEFITSNVILQHAIENSKFFKEGRIKLLKSYPEAGSVVSTGDKSPKPETKISGEVRAESGEVVEVGSLAEAAAYLKEHYGVAVSKVRSRADAISMGKMYNVQFVMHNS